jgi:hypothetical protein
MMTYERALPVTATQGGKSWASPSIGLAHQSGRHSQLLLYVALRLSGWIPSSARLPSTSLFFPNIRPSKFLHRPTLRIIPPSLLSVDCVFPDGDKEVATAGGQEFPFRDSGEFGRRGT